MHKGRGKRIATASERTGFAMTEWGDYCVYYVYILANATNVTLYTGVTNALERRLWEHKIHVDPHSFTAKYNVTKLVYYESTSDVKSALEREKQIKSWNRRRKNELIQMMNPFWKDLSL